MYAEESAARNSARQVAADIDELNRMIVTLMEGNKNARAVASGMLAVLQRANAAAEELMDHMAISDADDRTRLLVENLRRTLNAE
jgi:hypothetical protein